MTHQEHIFINTLDDIREKLNRGDRYSIIRASGLLRQLLIDDSPLVHQVNRNYGISISLETIDFKLKPPIKPFFHLQNIDASAFPDARKVTSNLSQFLEAECLLYNQHEYTVKDIIKACANIMGGVHSGVPKTIKEQSLLQIDNVMSFGGLAPSLAALRGIVNVVLVALAPLESAIKEQDATIHRKEI